MKKSFSFVALISTTVLMSFTTNNSTENTENTEVAGGFTDVKIKNNTCESNKVITSSGGSSTVKNQVGVTIVTIKDGDASFLYDGCKKGKKLFTATSDLDGKTLKLSDLM